MINSDKKYLVVEFCPEKSMEFHGEYLAPSWVYMNSANYPKFCDTREKATKFSSLQKAVSVCKQTYEIYDFSPYGASRLNVVTVDQAEGIEALWHVISS